MLSSPLISSVSAAPQPVSASIWAQPERCLKRGEAKRGAVTHAFFLKTENVKSQQTGHWNGFLLTKLMQWFYNISKATNKLSEIAGAVILKKTKTFYLAAIVWRAGQGCPASIFFLSVKTIPWLAADS